MVVQTSTETDSAAIQCSHCDDVLSLMNDDKVEAQNLKPLKIRHTSATCNQQHLRHRTIYPNATDYELRLM